MRGRRGEEKPGFVARVRESKTISRRNSEVKEDCRRDLGVKSRQGKKNSWEGKTERSKSHRPNKLRARRNSTLLHAGRDSTRRSGTSSISTPREKGKGDHAPAASRRGSLGRGPGKPKAKRLVNSGETRSHWPISIRRKTNGEEELRENFLPHTVGRIWAEGKERSPLLTHRAPTNRKRCLS